MDYTIRPEDKGKRLDIFITETIGSVSRAFIGRLCDQGKILVNGEKQKNGYKLRATDKISVDYDFDTVREVPEIDLPVIYEDKDCLVVNKPIGVLTHSKGAFNPEGTVATFITDKISGMEGDRAGIVHRLDRATSGVIICAKTPESLSALQTQFSQRKAKKTYYAIIEGMLNPDKAVIEVPIERNPRDPKTFRAGSMGKPAVTSYEVIKSNEHYSLVKLMPQTGRTHQLRVHLRYVGHPIVGDPIYGGKSAKRMYLHAESLEITTPSRQRKIFVAPLPDDFRAIMNT
jgi:23S rRNA pseudouridine1911/1915/1917 synthase